MQGTDPNGKVPVISATEEAEPKTVAGGSVRGGRRQEEARPDASGYVWKADRPWSGSQREAVRCSPSPFTQHGRE